MHLRRAEELAAEGLLSQEQLQRIIGYYKNRLFSIRWELSTILYLGVSLLAGGVGILIYMNIDTIGHTAIMAILAALCAGSFFYVFKMSAPFTTGEVTSPTPFFDYVLLLGSLLFVSLETYLHYQYHIFGSQYNLATLLPALIFIILAYRFDHKGLLSMAIAGLAGSVGLTVTPLDLLDSNDFSSTALIVTGIVFGLITGGVGLTLYYTNIKRHFTFTFFNFAAHIAFVSTLAGVFEFDLVIVFAILTGFLTLATYWYALQEKSLYFLLVAVIYSYIGLTYLFFRILFVELEIDLEIGVIYISLFYLIGTSLGIVYLFRNYRKILRVAE